MSLLTELWGLGNGFCYRHAAPNGASLPLRLAFQQNQVRSTSQNWAKTFSMEVMIHGVNVIGVNVDNETRCAHYHGPNDIIAIKFKCCGQWFPCYQCHAELAGHAAGVWPRNEFDTPAVLCGSCGQQLTIREYLQCDSTCPYCREKFNPQCAEHRNLYFESHDP
jgi:uncharacterized CHY-type Zn-finger protein